MKLVECVPNFSEGRDRRVIDAITDAVRSVPGVRVLDVDPGAATNRTVYTFAGPPEAVLEAAFAAIKKGSELIDMRTHQGEHARQGACDVCPFVPISGVTMAECVALAESLAKRVGDELKIPVYLYAEAARKAERRRLPDIRAGEYEALKEKLTQAKWKPDCGPAAFNARSGATAIGARGFLIAYNVNLNSRSVKLAKEISFGVRETGRVKKDKRGNIVRGRDGVAKRIPGKFKDVQGTGWLIPEYNRAQVTVNILDIDAAPLHEVYDECCRLAAKLGCRVTGSEIIGMVPKRVLTEAGLYFLKKQKSSQGVSEAEIIRTAEMSLGLSDVAPFDAGKKIIEERFRAPDPLAAMTVKAFNAELASNSPAPGGGSVAALAGALSAGLSSMAAALTYDKKGFEKVKKRMQELGVHAQQLADLQLKAIDGDTAAFNKVMACFGLPNGSKEQQAARAASIEEAVKGATLEPLRVLERTLPSLDLAAIAAEKGNPNSLSDAGVAGLMARASAFGAYFNVLINLAGLKDKEWAAGVRDEADRLLAEALRKSDRLESSVLTSLRKPLHP